MLLGGLRSLGFGSVLGAAICLLPAALGAAPGELLQLLTFGAFGVGTSRLVVPQKNLKRLLIAALSLCACASMAGSGPVWGLIPTLSLDSELTAAALGLVLGLGWGIALQFMPTSGLGLLSTGGGLCLGFLWPVPALCLGLFSTWPDRPSRPAISSTPPSWSHAPLLALATTVGAASWNASRANLDPTSSGLCLYIGAALAFASASAWASRRTKSTAVGTWLVAFAALTSAIALTQLPHRSWQFLGELAGREDPRWTVWLLQGALAAPFGLALGWLLPRSSPNASSWFAAGIGLWLGIRAGNQSFDWAIGVCLLLALTLALRRGEANRRIAGAALVVASLVAWIRPITWPADGLGEGRITHLREARSPSRARSQLEQVVDRQVNWGASGASAIRSLGSASPEVELDGYLVEPTSRAAAAIAMAPHLAASFLPQRKQALVVFDPLGSLASGLIEQEFSQIEVVTRNVATVRHLADTDPAYMNTMLHPSVRLSRSAAEVRIRGASDIDALLEVAFTPWTDAFQGLPKRQELKHRKAALAPHGLYILVATTSWMEAKQFRGILSDMAEVFPAAWAFLPPNGADQVVLVGWKTEPSPSWDNFLEGAARGLDTLATLDIRSALDLADRAISGSEAMAELGKQPTSLRPWGLSSNLHNRPAMHLTTMRDSLEGARSLFGETLEPRIGDLLDDRAETQRNFLELLEQATHGDIREVYAQSRALLEKSSGARALDPVIEPYLESARTGITQGLKEGPSSSGWTRAQRSLSTAQLLHPKSAAVQALLGEPLLAQGNLARAAEHFTKALKLEEGRVDALHGLARVALQRGNVAGAEQHLVTAVERNPSDWTAVHNLGVFLYERGRFAEAEERLRKSAHLAGESIAAPHSALAQLYLANNQPTRALVEAARATSLQPNGLNHYLRGKAYYEVDQVDAAANAFQEAVLSDPDNWQAQGGLGLVYARRGQYKRCVQSFRKVLAAEPGNPAAQENLRRCQDAADQAQPATAGEPAP
ncbi:MAG: tetratricopeptide repeat protein [Myxococcota bacterium]|nr:tetratricopeptide repeat protein [Myxococcota bacterium]